jgi:PUA domain (predicted RNA-binding domain)
MIERICPKCKVPMKGEKCIKKNCGCNTEMSSTIYWCEECNIPIYEKVCSLCGHEGKYIATDLRPVFPEEQILLAFIFGKEPFYYKTKSVWYGSNAYIINGKKVKLSVGKLNKWSLEKIKVVKEQYEENIKKISYEYFNKAVERFVKANNDRYNFITEEAIRYVQGYRERYAIEDMVVSFSGGKDMYISFLDEQFNGNIDAFKAAFRWSNAYLWLLSTLEENGGCLYFGALTEKLHNALVTDPKPYRKDVKILLSNLLSIVETVNMEEIKIDRPNFSQRIMLCK